ncbi:cystatin-B-like [Trichomycterus rosablanca]|uniref:cystatin-B-like n=1 Tax=Trichomycterus rosablanca TaxID=2290929 RepID=UPI002F3514A1
MATLCGGTGTVKHATKEVQRICDEVKVHVEEKTGKKFEEFKATSFSAQTVAGTNYFIKVKVGGDDYLHVKVFRSLPSDGYKLNMQGVQSPKTHKDPIDYF